MSGHNRSEADRPLGVRGSGPRHAAAPRMRLVVPASLAAIALVLSTTLAFQDEPFRNPPPVAVSQPMAAAEPAVQRETGTDVRQAPVQPGDSFVVIRDPSQLNRNEATAHLPDPDLIEASDVGALPRRAADGRRPFDAYRRAWSGTRGARVAIVLGGLGLSQTGTQAAIEALPGEVTLAFSPHGNSLDRWMQAARRAGHEIWLQVPLEPFDYPNVDPGRDTLVLDDQPSGRLQSLHRSMGRMTNYVGILNYMGARFTADNPAMAQLMEELSARGLGYLDDGSSARSVAQEMAQRGGVPFAAADLTIDGVRERGEILKRLDELERIARARGSAVGAGSVFDVTVGAVAAWVVEARLRGIEIVAISALADDPER